MTDQTTAFNTRAKEIQADNIACGSKITNIKILNLKAIHDRIAKDGFVATISSCPNCAKFGVYHNDKYIHNMATDQFDGLVVMRYCVG